METYSTDNNGSYAGATISKLEAIEPTLASASLELPAAELGTSKYEIVSKSDNGNKFNVKNVSGVLTFSCSTAGKGGCPSSGKWSE